MRLLEFQAKTILAKGGIPVPNSLLITSPDDSTDISVPTMLKAQVPVGGRGKAGAIKRVEQVSELASMVDEMLSSTVKGYPVQALLAEDPVEAEREIYVSCLIDKQANLPLLMASAAGGVDIEEVAVKSPERIVKRHIDPYIGLQEYAIRSVAKSLEIEDLHAFSELLRMIWDIFREQDATLIEINPLAITENRLVALDAKIMLDEKASFRHQRPFEELRAEQKKLDRRMKIPAQRLSEERQINYVPLKGDIGMIADGAGTGMLTLDLIHDLGGKPANFCEMGGQAGTEIMKQTMEVVLADERVKILIISLIGGLTRMDEMAEGIVRYLKEGGHSVPIFTRMCGTKADVGIPILRKAGVETYEDLILTVRTALEKSKRL